VIQLSEEKGGLNSFDGWDAGEGVMGRVNNRSIRLKKKLQEGCRAWGQSLNVIKGRKRKKTSKVETLACQRGGEKKCGCNKRIVGWEKKDIPFKGRHF